MSRINRIIIDKNIRHGKPVIKGTRVPVDLIVGSLAGGASMEEICEDYGIEKEDILAALEYAAQIISNEEVGDLAVA